MIILTGASGGLGLALIKNLAKIDFVCGIYHKNKPKIPSIKNVKFFKVDLTKDNSIKKFVSELSENKITVIHLAAHYKEKILINTSALEYDEHYQINQKAIFMLNKYLIKIMIHNNWGRVIMISSPAAGKGHPGTSAYSSTKSSLLGLSNVIVNEYSRFNITSNIIVAGYFDVGIYKTLSKITKQKLIGSIPSKKLGNIESVANAIEFIIKSDFVNGSTIKVDGGVN
jgi:3-oxoacyl-[acyl-carrier protein] reductase